MLLLSAFAITPSCRPKHGADEFFWTESGCPKLPKHSGNFVIRPKEAPGRCMHASQGAAIRCCGDRGACTSICEARPLQATPPHQPQIPGVSGFAASHEQASAECAAIGMRLCTRQELARSMCCRSGCQADGALVWTADACTDAQCASRSTQHCIARFRGSSTPGDTHWCNTAREPNTDILLCSSIKDTLGSSLSLFISLVTFVRAFQQRTRLRVALQLPSLRDDAGGGEATEWPIQTLYSQTSLRDVMPGVSLLGRGHAACTDRAHELALNRVVSMHPLAASQLSSVALTSPTLTASPDTFLQAFAVLTRAGRAWANSSAGVGCPIRVYLGDLFSPIQCSTTAFPHHAAEVGRALRFRPPSTREVPPEIFETASRCAYVYFREAPVRGTLRMTGPNPAAGGVHRATGPRYGASLAEVGAVLAQIVTTANISCVGVNSLPDAAGGKAAVLHGLQAGATGLDLRWLRFEPRSVNAADVNHLQMALAAKSPLLITERGTLWTDAVGMARMSSGKRTVVMHKKHARGKVLHEDVSACKGLLVRGSCVKQGEDPYPGARVPCFD